MGLGRRPTRCSAYLGRGVSTSDQIRALARDGLPVADIARRVGVRYQHAYNVLKAAGLLASLRSNVVPRSGRSKDVANASVTKATTRPPLTADILLGSGFVHSARWIVAEDKLVLDRPLPRERGVYAFAKDGVALYVGLATMGLAKRLYFYGKPGSTQRTSQRLNGLLLAELGAVKSIDIYTACPPMLDWNGLPVRGDAGLEAGLIEAFALPWNIRGVRP